MSRAPLQSSWSHRTAFIMAAIGSAVGLGNIWKFPYMAGTQGGGAFVLIYLATIFLIAIPIAVAELLIGRSGGGNVVHSIRVLRKTHHRVPWWQIVSGISMLTTFVLMSFYAVIAGWVMAYLWRAFRGQLADITADNSAAMLNSLLASPMELIFWQIAFLALVGFVSARQIRLGLERANMILMPTLFIMLIIIAVYGIFAGTFGEALTFLFMPDFSKIDDASLLAAVGHGFFSVGVGTALLITYASYMHDRSSLAETAVIIGLADTIIALLAGIGIFSIVYANALDPAQGPGLIFVTLPVAFAEIAGGQLLAIIFFLLVLFAAWTSALSIIEVMLATISEELHLSRPRATFAIMLGVFLLGLLTVFSFNIWSDVRIWGFPDKNLFDVKDYLTSSILLPLGGLCIVLFAAWRIPANASQDALGTHSRFSHTLWLWLARVVAPVGILWVFWEGLTG